MFMFVTLYCISSDDFDIGIIFVLVAQVDKCGTSFCLNKIVHQYSYKIVYNDVCFTIYNADGS